MAKAQFMGAKTADKTVAKSGISKHKMGMFVLAMMTFISVANLRGLPSMAEYGLSSVFYYIVIALAFFIPVSLIAAELATGWPKKGGVYLWVREAFGQNWGFLAVWLQWNETIFWFPTLLSFVGATLAFVINPALAANPLFIVGTIVVLFWATTLLNFRGLKTSGDVATIGTIVGVIIPSMIIILFGAYWIFSGNPIQIEISWDAFFPDVAGVSTMVLAAGVLLAYSGMEISAVHVNEVKNPQRDYPIAIGFAVALIVAIFILGTLAISIVVPQKDISLVAGVMEAFSDFFHSYHLDWMTPFIAIAVVIGALAQLSAWIIGPSKGLLASAEDGALPPFFQKTNAVGVPVNVLYVQAAVVTLVSLVFLIMPNVSSSYWILIILNTQIYLIMYVMMFAAAIKLRYSQPNVVRAYRVPGGNLGMWFVGGLGALAATAGFVIGFIPPSQMDSGSSLFFHVFLGGGIILVIAIGFLIHHFKKPEWKPAPAVDKKLEELIATQP